MMFPLELFPKLVKKHLKVVKLLYFEGPKKKAKKKQTRGEWQPLNPPDPFFHSRCVHIN